jgi:hypothetical protein
VDKINLGNKFSIYMQKVIFFLLIMMAVCRMSLGQDNSFSKKNANKRVELNLPHYDERRLHYGFTIGINSTKFKKTESEYYLNDTTLLAVKTPRSPGFSLGFIVNLKLVEFFDLRLLPTVSFYERTVEYNVNGSTDKQTIEPVFLELPLMLKYKSERRRNSRMYMIAGIKPAIEAGAKKKDKKETDLRTNNKDLSLEYGFGFDIYYPLFKFSPEIRVSHGLINMLSKDPNPFSQSLTRLTSHTISVYLHFQ